MQRGAQRPRCPRSSMPCLARAGSWPWVPWPWRRSRLPNSLRVLSSGLASRCRFSSKPASTEASGRPGTEEETSQSAGQLRASRAEECNVAGKAQYEAERGIRGASGWAAHRSSPGVHQRVRWPCLPCSCAGRCDAGTRIAGHGSFEHFESVASALRSCTNAGCGEHSETGFSGHISRPSSLGLGANFDKGGVKRTEGSAPSTRSSVDLPVAPPSSSASAS